MEMPKRMTPQRNTVFRPLGRDRDHQDLGVAGILPPVWKTDGLTKQIRSPPRNKRSPSLYQTKRENEDPPSQNCPAAGEETYKDQKVTVGSPLEIPVLHLQALCDAIQSYIDCAGIKAGYYIAQRDT